MSRVLKTATYFRQENSDMNYFYKDKKLYINYQLDALTIIYS